MALFWVVAPCSLVEVYQRFILMMEAAGTSETPVNFYQTTRRNNSEDSHLQTRRRENLKSHDIHTSCLRTVYQLQRSLTKTKI
jgi:hypothetical protein